MKGNNRTQMSQDHEETDNLNPAQIGLINTEDLRVIKIVVNVVLSGTISIFGTFFNVINIVVFLKQGLNNTVNISMFAIAVSDLCSLVTLIWVDITGNPFMQSANVPFEPFEIEYLTGGWPHHCFLQITILITVYVTVERFVCIALPLKVKQIFTPLRAKVVISLIYFMMFLALSPEYIAFYWGENFYPARNQTRLGLKNRNIAYNLDDLVFMLFSVIGTVSFIILVIFTCMLVVALYQRTQWRKKSTSDGNKSQAISRRDTQIMHMVGLIAGFLIICTAPGKCLSAAMFANPDFNFSGEYANITHTSWAFAFLAEAISSTANIIFFYKMSSKYKQTFHELLPGCIADSHLDSKTKHNKPMNVLKLAHV